MDLMCTVPSPHLLSRVQIWPGHSGAIQISFYNIFIEWPKWVIKAWHFWLIYNNFADFNSFFTKLGLKIRKIRPIKFVYKVSRLDVTFADVIHTQFLNVCVPQFFHRFQKHFSRKLNADKYYLKYLGYETMDISTEFFNSNVEKKFCALLNKQPNRLLNIVNQSSPINAPITWKRGSRDQR